MDKDYVSLCFTMHAAALQRAAFLLLLGLNVAYLLNGLPTNGFTLTLGIPALVWGGLELVGSILQLPFELPIFVLVLIVLEVILLARELQRSSND